jgi:predicted transcriptional regulator
MKPHFTHFLGFLARVYFWNESRLLRTANWLNVVNVMLIFSPVPAGFRASFSGISLLFTLIACLLWFYNDRHRRRAYKVFQQQGGFWMQEMSRTLAELIDAQLRYAPRHELAELEEKFEYASKRCERELTLVQASSRK